MNKDFSSKYNIYYYDDKRNKHVIYQASEIDLKYIRKRFGNENVEFFEDVYLKSSKNSL